MKHFLCTILAIVVCICSATAQAPQERTTAAGRQIGTTTAQKIAFHGSAPVAQRSGASQAAIGTLGTNALTGTLTGTLDDSLANLPTITDSPATADALRDDLVTNVVPVVNKNVKELQQELDDTIADLNAVKALLQAP